jgi:DNA-directed RNA polymerase specialized sigma24 family protein
MVDTRSSFSLEKLLADCCDNRSPAREAAWREFLGRYKTYIYQVITHRCLSWQVSRLRRQLSDVVNDIVSEVFAILLNSLDQFRAVEDENKFRSWLATVANRAASRYLKREFISEMADPDLEEFQNYIHGLAFDCRWELFESVVERMRATDSIKKRHLERDINLFQFYVWADLSQAMIQVHPCYVRIGHRVIDNVVNRLRESLRKTRSAKD